MKLRKQKQADFELISIHLRRYVAGVAQIVPLLPYEIVDAGDHERRAFGEVTGQSASDSVEFQQLRVNPVLLWLHGLTVQYFLKLTVIKAELSDVKAMQLRLREDFNRFEGDLLRFERIEAGTQLRLDRIESRLNLTDA